MNTIKRTIAATELLLIFPAALFMTALIVRSLQPRQYEPARTAQQIVTWYSLRPGLGLWVLLVALPLAVLGIGCVTLLRSWNDDAALRDATMETFVAIRTNLSTLFIAALTATAGGILAIVAVHMAMN